MLNTSTDSSIEKKTAGFQADCLPTAIGSFPMKDATQVLDAIMQTLPDIPTWPQLPNRDFLEGFFAQYVAAMPAIRIDSENERLFMDTSASGLEELAPFFQKVLDNQIDDFELDPEAANGFFLLLERLKYKSAIRQAVKGHITGPISFGLGLKDENQKAIIYNDTFFEAVRASISLQAAWQIKQLKQLAEHVIIFLDEPSLMSFGSAYTQFTDEQAVSWLEESISSIHEHGGLAGVHCCGNTDWSILFRTSVDIVNFDAYNFFDSLMPYIEPLRRFIHNGGILACGIIPTVDEVIKKADSATLAQTLLERLESLDTQLPLEDLLRQVLITPACGLGTCDPEMAIRALKLNQEVSGIIRIQYDL